MAAKIIYSSIARNDLQEIFAFISKRSLRYAQKEVHDIRAEIKGLKLNLFLGNPFYDDNDHLTRQVIFKNYRIIYTISPDSTQIQILTIHHHSRLLSNNAAFNDED